MFFEINGLKNFKLTILRVFAQNSHFPILLYSSKNVFIVKTSWIHVIFILTFKAINKVYKGILYNVQETHSTLIQCLKILITHHNALHQHLKPISSL